MKKYTKTYFKYFGYDISDWIPCEYCGRTGIDIHHIEPQSTAKKLWDTIENLVSLCRECHNMAGANEAFNEKVKQIHLKNLK